MPGDRSAKPLYLLVLCKLFSPKGSVADFEERVIDIVAEQLGVSKDQIKHENLVRERSGADSLDTVELVMELEEEFDINIPDDVAEKIQTVGQAIEHIEKAVQNSEASSS